LPVEVLTVDHPLRCSSSAFWGGLAHGWLAPDSAPSAPLAGQPGALAAGGESRAHYFLAVPGSGLQFYALPFRHRPGDAGRALSHSLVASWVPIARAGGVLSPSDSSAERGHLVARPRLGVLAGRERAGSFRPASLYTS